MCKLAQSKNERSSYNVSSIVFVMYSVATLSLSHILILHVVADLFIHSLSGTKL